MLIRTVDGEWYIKKIYGNEGYITWINKRDIDLATDLPENIAKDVVIIVKELTNVDAEIVVAPIQLDNIEDILSISKVAKNSSERIAKIYHKWKEKSEEEIEPALQTSEEGFRKLAEYVKEQSDKSAEIINKWIKEVNNRFNRSK